MSVRIALLQLTGQLKTAEKIEASRNALEKSYKAFLEAESSEKLKNYRELEGWINSGAYTQRKREVESEVFKGSVECNQLREFEKLKNSKPITNFFKIDGSTDLKRFAQIQNSDKLDSFYTLKEFAENGEFKKAKQKVESQRFSGSAEEKHLNEFSRFKNSRAFKAYFLLNKSDQLARHQKFGESPKLKHFLYMQNVPEKDKPAIKELKLLKRDAEIRSYFRLENSQDLKYYREVSGSRELERYDKLQHEISGDAFKQRVAFLKDKKKLEKSEAWKKVLRYRELAADSDIKFYEKFEKSGLYKNYLDVKDSFSLQRYHELHGLTKSADFLKRKAYLEDSKKWEKTQEYARSQQFEALKKDTQIVFYFKNLKNTDFDFCKNHEISFIDDFTSKTTDSVKWTANTFWADRLLGDNFSQPGDLQAYTGGRNTSVAQGKMVISVKKENAKSKHWLPTAGFVPVDFHYTADTQSTIKSFWQQYGIFEAKIKFSPVKQVVSSCHLLGENVMQQITLLEMGPQPRLGVLQKDNYSNKVNFAGIDLGNLKKNVFYIFHLEWEGNHFTWKINDKVVHEATVHDFNFQAHLNFTSLVVDEIPGSLLPVNFEVAWVKCFRKR